MKTVAYWIFAFLGVSFILLWLYTQLRYRIGAKHLKVVLFGIPLRRVALSNIRHISKRRTGICEHWWNTFKPAHRMLTIHKHRGVLKNFVITPRNRYVFMTELQAAMRRVNGESAPTAKTLSEAGEISEM